MSKKQKPVLGNETVRSLIDSLQAALEKARSLPTGRQVTFRGGTATTSIVMPSMSMIDRILALRGNAVSQEERGVINAVRPCFDGGYVQAKLVIPALAVMIRHADAQLRGEDPNAQAVTTTDGHLALDGVITSPANLAKLRVGFIAAQRSAEEAELFVTLPEFRRHLPNLERLTELFGTVVTDDWFEFVTSTMASLYEGNHVNKEQMARSLRLLARHIDFLSKRAAEAAAHEQLVKETMAEALDLQSRIRTLGGTTPTIDPSRLRHSGDCAKLIRELRQQHDELLEERLLATQASAIPQLDELRRRIERLGGNARPIDRSSLTTAKAWEDAVTARKDELNALQKRVAAMPTIKPITPKRPDVLSMFRGARTRLTGTATGS